MGLKEYKKLYTLDMLTNKNNMQEENKLTDWKAKIRYYGLQNFVQQLI